jgi:hypothetical protein
VSREAAGALVVDQEEVLASKPSPRRQRYVPELDALAGDLGVLVGKVADLVLMLVLLQKRRRQIRQLLAAADEYRSASIGLIGCLRTSPLFRIGRPVALFTPWRVPHRAGLRACRRA